MKEMVWSTMGKTSELGSFTFVCLSLVIWVLGRALFFNLSGRDSAPAF
jgi:hypothetical protein